MKVKVTIYETRKSFIIVEAASVVEAGDKIRAQIDEGNLLNSLNWTIVSELLYSPQIDTLETQRVDNTEEV